MPTEPRDNALLLANIVLVRRKFGEDDRDIINWLVAMLGGQQDQIDKLKRDVTALKIAHTKRKKRKKRKE